MCLRDVLRRVLFKITGMINDHQRQSKPISNKHSGPRAAVTAGINHRWVTSSVCLGGNSHVDRASSSSVSCALSSPEAPEGGFKTLLHYQRRELQRRRCHSRAGPLSPLRLSFSPRFMSVSLMDRRRVQTHTCWDQESWKLKVPKDFWINSQVHSQELRLVSPPEPAAGTGTDVTLSAK